MTWLRGFRIMMNGIFLGISIGSALTAIVHLVCWPFVDITITDPGKGLTLNLGDMALLWFLLSICTWKASGITIYRTNDNPIDMGNRVLDFYMCRECPYLHGAVVIFRRCFIWRLPL